MTAHNQLFHQPCADIDFIQGTLKNPNGTVSRVAIKMLKDKPQAGVDQLIKEAEIMCKMMHPNLVRLLGVCYTSKVPMMVTELVALGPLNVYLMDNRAKMTAVHLSRFAFQVPGFDALLNSHSILIVLSDHARHGIHGGQPLCPP